MNEDINKDWPLNLDPLDLAVKYDGAEWTKVGSLLNARFGHRSILMDNIIVHIGGVHNSIVHTQ